MDKARTNKKATSDNSASRIGLIGLGLVGSALFKLLKTQGFQIYGFDIVQEKCKMIANLGGIACSSPAEVAEHCDRILLSLMTAEIVEDVIKGENGILKSTHRPKFIIDSSTMAPDTSVSISELCKNNGINYIDAPISGSSGQIEQHEGVLMIGGEKTSYELCKEIWKSIGRQSFYMGENGKGSQAKLIINLIVGLNRLALAEGLFFAEKNGVNLQQILSVMKESAAYSKVMDIKGERMILGNFEPEAKLNQHRKDVGLILDQAAQLGIKLPLSELHLRLLENAISAGDGELDNSAIIKELKRQNLKIS